MDNKEQYLRDLLYEAKEIRRQLESIKYSLKDMDRIKDKVDEIQRTLERKK
jgi:prefoldin subunit 5